MQLELFSKKEGNLFKDIEKIDVAEILELDGNKRFPLLEKNHFTLYKTGCKDFILKKMGNIFPGLYNEHTGRFIKPKLRGGGSEYRVWLMRQRINKKEKYKTYDIECHRLIALAFIVNPDPKNKTVVNHKDHNKGNYFLKNLEWASRRENSLNKNIDKGIMKRREQVLIEKYNA